MNDNTNVFPSMQEIRAHAQDICYSCEGVVWTSFFFDGFGYSLPEFGGTSSISNIGKLYRAAERVTEKKDQIPFYYPGLGTRFDPELDVISKTAAYKVMQDAKARAIDTLKPDNPIDTAQKKAADYTQIKAVDLLKAHTASGVADVLAGVGNEFADAAKSIGREASELRKRGLKETLDRYAQMEVRRLNRIVDHWRSFVSEIRHHPWRALRLEKVALKSAIEYTFGRAVEAVPARDWRAVASLFNTGVDTRLEAAEHDFTRAVYQAQRLFTVKHINVALFGYDNGGALAIAFAQRLINEICSKGRFEGLAVNLRFMGLFDCVSHRFSDNLVAAYVPLSDRVVNDLRMPTQVEKVVHLCAAHEYRFYKPLSLIGGRAEMGAKYEEWMYPGAQADVGGGYEDGEQGKSDHLARVALNFMHMQARRQAVPLLSMNRLSEDNPRLHETFVVDPAVEQLVRTYRREALALAAQVVPFTIEELKQPITVTRTQCLRGPSLIKPMMHLPESLKEEFRGHQALFILWFRAIYDTHLTSLGDGNEDDYVFSQLRKEMDVLARSEIRAPLYGEVQEMYELWRNAEGHSLPEALQPLFSRYVHNSFLVSGEYRWQGQLDLLCAPNQLKYRNTLEIAKQSTTDWLKMPEEYAQTLKELGSSGYRMLF
ncbi:DUF2235 domain-containing protein [Burkholderia sp. L27(2015)]|uniref:phospholipase effector Tle1 domain-containing protein n=1 Tax=Burkholderia sp. L27(2015) TaxID=1641858 RepID=UPI00131CFC87|nr:DUF2235 domain-containing protein [Burkholderia sp. L27(2015)]